MKKFKLLIALMTSVFVFAGCGSSDEASDQTDNQTAVEDTTDDSTTTDDTATDEVATDALNIAIISSPSGVDDGSFNQNNYEGILSFIENHPESTVTPIQEPTGSPDAAMQELNNVVGDYDVFVLCGFQFAGASQTAVDNPDKYFILVDSEPNPVDDQTEFDNLVTLSFKEQESSFLAGVAAAMETQTNKVAVVNGIAYPSNVNYQYGFEAGVNYANKNLGTAAELVELPSYAGTDVTGANVGGNYIGNFDDEATGKIVGQKLLDEGVDIALVAAGNSGNGVFTAFKESPDDVKVIGCDVDQYDDGVVGDRNIVLTSALKVMDINVERQLETIVDGTFTGGNLLLDATTDSTGIVTEEGRQQMSDETIEAVNQLSGLIKDGTIVPPSNFSGTTPEDFPGL